VKYGCIGEHLKHSFSKDIHEQFAPYSYEICEIPKDEINIFLEKADFSAINVTIPYKETVIPHLHFISEQAKEIGAVNTVVNKDGKLYGYNTDFFGMKSLIEKMELSLEGKKVIILGTGGTSKTAYSVAKSLKANSVFKVSRSSKKDSITYDELYTSHNDAEIIINTTPSGMFPNWNTCPVYLEKFNNLCGVVDVVYNPLNTSLVRKAKSLGIKAETGLYMLVAQAVKASEIFLNVEYPKETIENVYRKILIPKKNIILVGMPSCGKSTVGDLISKKLNMPLWDSDKIIEERCKMSISEIFKIHGENYFRDIESEIIAELSSKNGIVLSTGGGAILRKENVFAMKQNGDVYFIDRSLEQLLPTEDRPLALTKDDIKKRFQERYDLYCSASDVRIVVNGDAKSVADEIINVFLER